MDVEANGTPLVHILKSQYPSNFLYTVTIKRTFQNVDAPWWLHSDSHYYTSLLHTVITTQRTFQNVDAPWYRHPSPGPLSVPLHTLSSIWIRKKNKEKKRKNPWYKHPSPGPLSVSLHVLFSIWIKRMRKKKTEQGKKRITACLQSE